jgi:hypothetical protein
MTMSDERALAVPGCPSMVATTASGRMAATVRRRALEIATGNCSSIEKGSARSIHTGCWRRERFGKRFAMKSRIVSEVFHEFEVTPEKAFI